MKITNVFLSAIALIVCNHVLGQDKKVYTTTIIEFPLTWSNATDNGQELTGPVRFAPVFNFQNNINMDISEKAGVFAGLGIRNVGFIYDVDENTRKKVRTYNLGIPVGFKIGNMSSSYVYAGYEIEFPLNYKEKTFIDEEKSKFNTWFSDRTAIQQSLLFGIQMPYGTNIKFKYYFTNFFKEGYTDSTGQPYQNFNANVFWISLNIVLFTGTDFTYD